MTARRWLGPGRLTMVFAYGARITIPVASFRELPDADFEWRDADGHLANNIEHPVAWHYEADEP